MRTPRSHAPFSRRSALAGLSASAAVVATTRQASAQDETAEAAHPIIGLWMAKAVADGPPGLRGYLAIHAGGTLSSVHSFAGAGVGAWEATGERTATWTIKSLNIADVPGEYAEGTATFSALVLVDADGTTLNTVDAVELRGASSSVVQAFTGASTYVRVAAEAPPSAGTPQA